LIEINPKINIKIQKFIIYVENNIELQDQISDYIDLIERISIKKLIIRPSPMSDDHFLLYLSKEFQFIFPNLTKFFFLNSKSKLLAKQISKNYKLEFSEKTEIIIHRINF